MPRWLLTDCGLDLFDWLVIYSVFSSIFMILTHGPLCIDSCTIICAWRREFIAVDSVVPVVAFEIIVSL